jgi:membrane protease YdiL (CAAX protease family)
VRSLAFGLWPVGAALHPERPAAAGDVVGQHAATTAIAVGGDVVATAIAGLGFGWLRLRSGSVVAPALAHAALNATAYAATRVRSTSAR